MRKVGILGGTFDPIHNGHLLLAEWARDEIGLDEVWLIPSGVSYMKSGQEVLPAGERLYMTQLAAGENSAFRCLDTEVVRQGDTYTYETLEGLREANPDVKFFFLVGADCLFAIDGWREPQRIFDACVLVAALRDAVPMEEMERKRQELSERYGADIVLLSFPQVNISSTLIRNRVAEGKSIRYMVPEKVREYIAVKGFYRR